MPTGFTAILQNKDVTFNEFALRCTTAMGFGRDAYDEKTNTLKLVKVDVAYETEELKRAKKQKIPTKSEFEKEKKRQLAHYQDTIKKNQQLEARYNKMLQSVNAWNPASADYIPLKNFMIEQLMDSIQYDCNHGYYKTELAKCKKMTYAGYKKQVMDHNEWEIKYYTDQIKKTTDDAVRTNQLVIGLMKELA